MTTDTTIESIRLVKDSEAARIIGIGRSTWWAWVRDGKAPQPVKINDVTRWRLADVLALHERKTQ